MGDMPTKVGVTGEGLSHKPHLPNVLQMLAGVCVVVLYIIWPLQRVKGVV